RGRVPRGRGRVARAPPRGTSAGRGIRGCHPGIRRPRRVQRSARRRARGMVLGSHELLSLVPHAGRALLRQLQPDPCGRARRTSLPRDAGDLGVILFVTNVDTEVLALRTALEALPDGFRTVRAAQPWTV